MRLDGRALVFCRALVESLRSVPGVRDAAISSGVPFGVGNYTATPVSVVGKSVFASSASMFPLFDAL